MQRRALKAPALLWLPLGPAGRDASDFIDLVGVTLRRGEVPRGPVSPAIDPAARTPAVGTIVDVANVRLLGVDRMAPAAVLEVDEALPEPASAELADDSSSRREISPERAFGPGDLPAALERVAAAGVRADRWTSPNLLGQLRRCLNTSVDTIICTALDADPNLRVNEACASADAPALVAAVAALRDMTRATRAWIVVDENSAGVSEQIRAAAAEARAGVRLVPIAGGYPLPDPTLLIHRLTRRRLRPGRPPTDCRVVLFDAAAAVALGRALVANEPMLRVPLAVHHQPTGASHLLSVPLGMRMGDVLAELDLIGEELDLYAGAPLRDRRVWPDDVIGGAELCLFITTPTGDGNPTPCIRCGWCAEACPTRVLPAGVFEAAQENDMALALHFGINACIECGICSYVCPSHLPLLGSIRQLRNTPEP